MDGNLAALCFIHIWQVPTARSPEDDALNVPDEVLTEGKLQISEADYIPACVRLYATAEDVQYMIAAAFNVHEKIKLKVLLATL